LSLNCVKFAFNFLSSGFVCVGAVSNRPDL
jgi:hypothetical protein